MTRIYREYKNLQNLDPETMQYRAVEYKAFSPQAQRQILFKDITTGEVTHTTILDTADAADCRSAIGYFARTVMNDLKLVQNSLLSRHSTWESRKMPPGKMATRRVRILVKAYPQPGNKYEETVCCAGIDEDSRELLRLFPIRYRRLSPENRFDRFDQVKMSMEQYTRDPRPESYHVDEDSLRVTAKGDKLSPVHECNGGHRLSWSPCQRSRMKAGRRTEASVL
jgi:hypothetical protein